MRSDPYAGTRWGANSDAGLAIAVTVQLDSRRDRRKRARRSVGAVGLQSGAFFIAEAAIPAGVQFRRRSLLRGEREALPRLRSGVRDSFPAPDSAGRACMQALSRFICSGCSRCAQSRQRPRAGWQSGHAAACKAVYAGSIPTPASIVLFLTGFALETRIRAVVLARSSGRSLSPVERRRNKSQLIASHRG